MSSHHIVKEDQEPALLILDVKAAAFEMTQELLEWSPTVIVSDQTLQEVLLWGIKIDVVVVRTSMVDFIGEQLQIQAPVKILSCQDDGDPVLTALRFLHDGKYKSVNVLGGTFSILENFLTKLDIVCFNQGLRWAFIRSGVFEKWFPEGRIVTMQMGNHHETINTKEDGLVTISKDHPFWIAEE